MKNLMNMYYEAQNIIEECCGDVVKVINEVKVNNRAKSRWGLCRYDGYGGYTVEISKRILADNVPYNATMSTIVHELLHATDATGHGRKWQMYAR